MTAPAASREKREKWLQQTPGDMRAIVRLASEMIYQHGVSWLTDDQIEDMVREDVENWRQREKINRENRALRRAI